MKNRTSTWIFFSLFLLTASGVFAAFSENSRQGLPAISVTSHPPFSLENSEQHQGLSRVLLELMSVGAFISKDPIRFRGGHNLWKYADNNPMRWVDPWGLFLLPLVTDDTDTGAGQVMGHYLTLRFPMPLHNRRVMQTAPRSRFLQAVACNSGYIHPLVENQQY